MAPLGLMCHILDSHADGQRQQWTPGGNDVKAEVRICGPWQITGIGILVDQIASKSGKVEIGNFLDCPFSSHDRFARAQSDERGHYPSSVLRYSHGPEGPKWKKGRVGGWLLTAGVNAWAREKGLTHDQTSEHEGFPIPRER
jgi:hypothetical protein